MPVHHCVEVGHHVSRLGDCGGGGGPPFQEGNGGWRVSSILRGITLLSLSMKVYYQFAGKENSSISPALNLGFHPCHSTVDHLFTLSRLCKGIAQ